MSNENIITDFRNACNRGNLIQSTEYYNLSIQDAALNGNIKVIEYLVSQGADITANNNKALINASKCDRIETVKFLVENGADLTDMNNRAIKKASENGNFKVVDYLLEKGADKTKISKLYEKHIILDELEQKNKQLEKEISQLFERNEKLKMHIKFTPGCEKCGSKGGKGYMESKKNFEFMQLKKKLNKKIKSE